MCTQLKTAPSAMFVVQDVKYYMLHMNALPTLWMGVAILKVHYAYAPS